MTSGPTASANPDLFVRHLCEDRPNMLVPHILIASLLYYEEDRPVLQDATFDWMCRELVARWGEVDHPHKPLITLDDLRAGTGYAFQYPERVRWAARAFAARFAPRSLTRRRKPT